MHRVFTYGTLKRGHGLNRFLAESTFLGDGVTEPNYKLHSNGSYPYLQVAESDGYSVKGEVYEVDKDILEILDQIELGAGYKRDSISVSVGDQVLTTEAYLWPTDRSLAKYHECEPKGEFI